VSVVVDACPWIRNCGWQPHFRILRNRHFRILVCRTGNLGEQPLKPVIATCCLSYCNDNCYNLTTSPGYYFLLINFPSSFARHAGFFETSCCHKAAAFFGPVSGLSRCRQNSRLIGTKAWFLCTGESLLETPSEKITKNERNKTETSYNMCD
jgi:hypothetical protein